MTTTALATSEVETPSVKTAVPGNTVRVVANVDGEQSIFYAHVLALSPFFPEYLGANGEPALTVAYLAATPGIGASRSDWQKTLTRTATVKHESHPDVVAGKEGIYYVDILPEAGKEVSLTAYTPKANPSAAGEATRDAVNGVGTGPTTASGGKVLAAGDAVKTTAPIAKATTLPSAADLDAHEAEKATAAAPVPVGYTGTVPAKITAAEPTAAKGPANVVSQAVTPEGKIATTASHTPEELIAAEAAGHVVLPHMDGTSTIIAPVGEEKPSTTASTTAAKPTAPVVEHEAATAATAKIPAPAEAKTTPAPEPVDKTEATAAKVEPTPAKIESASTTGGKPTETPAAKVVETAAPSATVKEPEPVEHTETIPEPPK